MNSIKRKFIPGDEWLYIKLYASYYFLNKILVNEISEAVEKFYDQKLIFKFFFVRYSDIAGPHLRLRFKIDVKQLSEILMILNSSLSPFIENRLIQTYSIETYNREIEKYSEGLIEHVESIFSYNSTLIIQALIKTEEDTTSNNYIIYSCKILDDFLNQFNLNASEKHEICEQYYSAYAEEFEVGRTIKEQLAKKYKTLQTEVIKGLKNEGIKINNLKLKIDSKNAVEQIVKFHTGTSRAKFFNFLIKLIHMHFNRVFISKPRENELVIYFILSKAYKTLSILEYNY